MDRLTIDEQQVENMRTAQLEALQNLTGHWAPKDDPKRSEVCPGSPLKVYDDVKLRTDGKTYRVITPSEGRTRFCCYGPGDFGMTLTSADLTEVADRAPVDPNETPMPVLAPESEPPPPWNPGDPPPTNERADEPEPEAELEPEPEQQ